MAQRYGGKYSPGESDNAQDQEADTAQRGNAFKGRHVDPAGARSNALFVPPIPLVFMSLNDGAIGMATGLAAAGILLLAAWLLREGLRAEAAYNVRRVSKRPAIPRKSFAAALSGLGVALAVYRGDMADGLNPGVLAPALYGMVATTLHLVAFGVDPMKDKGMDGTDSFQHTRVARAVNEGETYLSDMTTAIKRAGDRRIEARVEQFEATARDLFRTVEDDPRDLTSARKYLTVYLQGARDATVKFAEIYSRSRDPQALADYSALLDDLEQNFAARTRKMLLDDRSDLSIEIDVLRDRLQREGVRLD
ncbi:5-bromo-4-chloroindolyl phosphate hydrolysis family protein [Primorskyibacter sp. S87]|uniref:5-bromo-4-chloroindolyl phosphate hydrolysis family protein n=1 Tax=Primorskyibacter sp. S87 TaxID=3415126 RepID=UPI003C7ADD1E